MSDPEARRELAVARQIHASMGDSREVVGIADPTTDIGTRPGPGTKNHDRLHGSGCR